MAKTVEITIEEYRDSQLAAAKLNALECSGVDNWEWYSESFNEDYQENVKAIKEEYEELKTK